MKTCNNLSYWGGKLVDADSVPEGMKKELLGERRYIAWTLRKQGKTFREVGDTLGISLARARQLYYNAVRKLYRRALDITG